jgi:hypothetical protein
MERASGAVDVVPNQIAMKVTTLMTKNAASVSLYGPVETFIRVNTRMTSAMVMEKCTGRMAVVTRVSGLEEFSMVTDV